MLFPRSKLLVAGSTLGPSRLFRVAAAMASLECSESSGLEIYFMCKDAGLIPKAVINEPNSAIKEISIKWSTTAI